MAVTAPRRIATAVPDGRLDARLKALFDGEAAARTRAQDAAMLEAAIASAEAGRPLETERRRLEAALGRGFPIAA